MRTITTRRRLLPSLLALALLVALVLAGTSALAPLALGASRDGCTNETIEGAYGYLVSGNVFPPNAAVLTIGIVGREVFDGHGRVSGADTASVNGAGDMSTNGGTYDVQSDCTGSMTVTRRPSGIVVPSRFVIVERGRGLLLIQTDPGTVLTARYTRQ